MLSRRLSRTYALLFAATTLCLSLCVYGVSWHFLINRQQTRLATQLRNIAEIYYEEIAESHEPDDPEVLWELNTDDNMVLLLLSPEGEVRSRSGYYSVTAQEIPICSGKTALYRQSDGLALIASGTDVLVDGASIGVLTAVYRIDRECNFLKMLAWLLVLLNCVGAILALATGRFMTGRMLRPISAMIRRAQSIDAKALDARLEVPETEDELRLLAQTINGMLDRVEAAYLRQAQFAQDASHELRTPLAVLQGNADLLARWGKDDPVVRDACIAAIQRQTAYMHHMVENLLFLTRGDNSLQALQIVEIDLPALLQEVADVWQEIDSLHRYVLDAPDACKLCADETLLRQLLLILLDNAAKYTPEGRDIRLCAAQKSGMLELEVRDAGCGVPEDQLERIFDRFYRVDKARARESGGAGLGLSIAKTIVELHQGTIHAKNNAPGLSICITLPIRQG